MRRGSCRGVLVIERVEGGGEGPAFRRSLTQARGVLSWSVSAAAANLAAGILTAHAVSVAERGVLAIVVAIAGMSAVVSGLGTNVAIRHLLPRRESGVKFAHFLGLSLVLTPLAPTLSFVAIWACGGSIDPQMRSVYVLIMGSSCATVFFLSIQCLDVLNAHGKTIRSAALNAFGSFVQLLLIGTCYFLRAGLVAFLGAYAGGAFVQVAAGVWVLHRLGAELRPKHDRRAWATLLRVGLPSVGSTVGQVLASRLDRVLIGVLAGPAAAGLYAIATTPAEVLRMPPTAYGQVGVHGIASGSMGERDVWRGVALSYGIVAVPATILVLVAPELIVSVFGSEYGGAADPLRVLVLAELCMLPFQICGRALAGLGRSGYGAVAVLFGLAAGVPMLYYLVPRYGALGAAVASVVMYGTMSALAGLFFTAQWKRHLVR